MAIRRSGSTQTRKGEVRTAPELTKLYESLKRLRGIFQTARKNGFKIKSHTYYSEASSSTLTDIRREVLILESQFPASEDEELALKIADISPAVLKIRELLDTDLCGASGILDNLIGSLEADLSVALHLRKNHRPRKKGPGFVSLEILPAGVYRKVLQEANRCYDEGLPNACAAMIRRLIESLIIEAFEGAGKADKIKQDGEYKELKALIGHAIAELNLTKNTKNTLPNLKFFGDLSVHARRNLVHTSDLNRLFPDIRRSLEELAINTSHSSLVDLK